MKTSNPYLLAEIDILEDLLGKDASQLETVKRIEALETSLRYAVEEANGWHDSCNGGDIESEEMTLALSLIK